MLGVGRQGHGIRAPVAAGPLDPLEDGQTINMHIIADHSYVVVIANNVTAVTRPVVPINDGCGRVSFSGVTESIQAKAEVSERCT